MIFIDLQSVMKYVGRLSDWVIGNLLISLGFLLTLPVMAQRVMADWQTICLNVYFGWNPAATIPEIARTIL
ncbi:hypothetical protein BWI96_06100 [Siphonobacter sp. SORGH_AS_0500]|nr:hypothetical protein BWI96_06100 [Siphonobacter sp. SORGH_AS_0500]